MQIYPLQPGGAAEGVALASGPVTLSDMTALPRFGLKGRGSADWLVAQGHNLPEINRLSDGVLRLGGNDLVVIEGADDLRAAWQAADAPKGYDAWREETWAWMHLSGPRLDDLMAKICPVDLRANTFTEGQIAQTRVGYTEAVVWRAHHKGLDGFCVLFDISATAFFAQAIETAAQEFKKEAVL
ncbi:hypothetical protein GS636_13380 [Ruegeria sp. HKCCD4884]|uniref:hypothetical protein n=1 Tax=Ruegeria sp. HKCCD4884 TaxID=2683022 RepID=UPI0014913092|nr:hypothetical protein [Ruegeria sp. HKCCD4884]NOD93777.1 hypothetical protein [Ruegeria sp. HKCCD4884]